VAAAPREAALSAPMSVRERRSFDLVLVDPGDDLIALLREIRDSLRLSVSEAKALVDAVPQVIKPGLNMRDAHTLRARLEATGARVELRET
jgi:large subunit ribosomal protein L7/L12